MIDEEKKLNTFQDDMDENIYLNIYKNLYPESFLNEDVLKNNANKTNLEYFKIEGLFGRYNVNLKFNKQVNIYIGENGLGKTTILNCLYYVLTQNYSKLANIDFKEISVKFKRDRNIYKVSKSDVILFINGKYGRHSAINNIIEMALDELGINYNFLVHCDEYEFDSVAKYISDTQNISITYVKRKLFNCIREKRYNSRINQKGNIKNVDILNEVIKRKLKQKVIYLPTYRRIENDFSNFLNRDCGNDSELLIKFGMNDVKNVIDSTMDKIQNIAIEGYNQLTSVLLEQYLSKENNGKKIISKLDPNIVNIVLSRLGPKIDKEIVDKIKYLVTSKEIYLEENIYLLNLLYHLCESYDAQKEYDDQIMNFCGTCNKYLNGKLFVYNPTDLTLKIYLDNFKGMVDLTQLSSGEKQIVSLFSKLYLDSEENNLIIIDEPELSLSIKWQQMLLPDIMRSGKCKFLLTVTHSPFVFDNEYDLDAEDMLESMELYNE